MTKFLNYYKKDGRRTTMKITPAQEKALLFLCEYHGFKRKQEYAYYAFENSEIKEGTMAVKEKMFEELIEICGGQKIEILKSTLAKFRPELTDWIEINFGKIKE